MSVDAPPFLPNFLAENYFGQELVIVNRHIIKVATNHIDLPDKVHNKRVLYLISGGSGVGKDTLSNALAGSPHPTLGIIRRIKTCTTREEIRPDEIGYDPYVRLSKAEFKEGLDAGHFLESNFYANSDSYGTRKAEIAEVLSADHGILRIDPNGARAILNAHKNGDKLFQNTSIVYLFMVPSSMESLHTRLLDRYRQQYSEEVATQKADNRIKATVNDMTMAFESHYIVVNHDNEFPEVFKAVTELPI